jgi:RNA polymerase sigma-70 factor (ECF subfamily)
MHPPISRPDPVTLLDEADAAAARLRRRLRLPRADLDDLRQDLLVDLIRRLPAFDARRGSIGAFAGIVLRNHASRIAARLARERRATGGGLLSLDAPAGDDGYG